MFVDLILPMIVGYVLRQRSNLSERFYDRLIEATLVIVYPLLGVLSFWVIRVDATLLWLPLFGVLIHVIPGLLVYLRVKNKYEAFTDQGSYLMAGILSNHLTLGGLSVYILFGATGYAYVQLFVLPQSFILFLICFPLAQYYQRRSTGRCMQNTISWRGILFHRNQLGIVGVFVGLLFNGLAIERPVAAAALFDLLVHIGAWLSLVPVGYSIDFMEMRNHWRDTWDMAVIKFILTPIIIAVFCTYFVDEELMRQTLLVLSFGPVAINAVIAVRLHRLNLHIVMANFVFTTTVYLTIIYPVLFLWLR